MPQNSEKFVKMTRFPGYHPSIKSLGKYSTNILQFMRSFPTFSVILPFVDANLVAILDV